MNRPTGIILDLDGTVYRGDRLIPGACGAIEWLRRQVHRIVFVTNALESRAEHAAKLSRLNIPTEPDDVVNAPLVLTRYLNQQAPGATVFAIADPPLLEALGTQFELSEDPAEIDVVVASCDRSFDYRKLNIAFQALQHGAQFLATNADAACPMPGGELPDAGAVIGALEGCTGRRVERIIGKPSSLMADVVLERLRRSASECLMVGDSLDSDIVMGHRAGMMTTLVLTGVTRRADVGRAPVRPDHVLESVAELPALLDRD